MALPVRTSMRGARASVGEEFADRYRAVPNQALERRVIGAEVGLGWSPAVAGRESYSPGTRVSRGGDYSYLPGLVFASQAVIASPGMVIERACFPACLPLAEGFEAVRAALERFDRPLTALCGFDLRLPSARRLEDFIAFNGDYLERLRSWGAARRRRLATGSDERGADTGWRV
jgi:hypothetical protein